MCHCLVGMGAGTPELCGLGTCFALFAVPLVLVGKNQVLVLLQCWEEAVAVEIHGGKRVIRVGSMPYRICLGIV